MKIAAYCRVSRDDLNLENQHHTIGNYCKAQGWGNVSWFDEVVSTRKTRPIKQDLISKCRNKEYDTIIFTRLDRFARSTIELIMDIEELLKKNIRIISVMNGWDWHKKSYDSGQMLQLRLFSAFAEFEREIIRERTIEGLDRARAQGKKLGRPKGTTAFNTPTNEAVKHLLSQNKTERQIAKMLGASRYMVQKKILEITQGGINT